MENSTETMSPQVIHDTENYQVELHTDDADGLWYHIVNKEYGIAESRESLKPQALVYCEQFNILLKQETHKSIAESMVKGMAEEALHVYAYGDDLH